MLNRELRDLAHVPRWTVLRRARQQSVVEHSWFVAVYALELQDITGWKGSTSDLVQHALLHELEEVWTGDVPGPGKRLLINGHSGEVINALRERIHGIFPQHFRAYMGVNEDIRHIVKCADIMEAVFYLLDELQMGNRSVGSTADENSPLGANMLRLRRAWDAMPWRVIAGHELDDSTLNDAISKMSKLEWHRTMIPAMNEAEGGISRILVDKNS